MRLPVLFLALLTLAACGSSSTTAPKNDAASTPPSFLQSARAVVPPGFDGSVTDLVEAGGYTYLQVDSGPEGEKWVVILGGEVALGDAVSIRPYGQLQDFHSKRTGLTFETLLFATLTHRSA